MEWKPTISDRQGPLYQRIVAALADDISSGHLRQGQGLPTHRALAKALSVDLTTVTRAYAEAHRQGLTEATVGRGTFVKARPERSLRPSTSPGIDLSMNLPPLPPEADLDGRLAQTIAEVRADTGLSPYLTYQQPGGTAAERQAAADWMQTLVPGVTPDRIVLAPGTQAALYCMLLSHVAPGETVLTERLTYPGLKAAASAVGIRLLGLDMDEEGILPTALDRAARAGAGKVVYLMPTLHNPTTATMSPERRSRIAEVIRKHRLLLIEDDPYSFLTPGSEPIAAAIPEHTYLAASLSKCIAPGLRTSIVVAPDKAAVAQLASLFRATLQMPAPLMAAVAVRWMRDGTARNIVEAIRTEAVARQTLAREALAGQAYASQPNGHHIWLPLSADWPAQRFAAHLHGRGIAVVTGEAFATDATPQNAIRLALGAARGRAQLSKALEILSAALSAGAPEQHVV